MTFNDFMIIGKDIKNSADIIKKLNSKKPVLNCFLVADNKGTLEIYPAVGFVQQNLNALDIDIVAIFRNKKEAFEFIRVLADISIRKFGRPDLIKALPFYEEEVM